MLKYLDPSSLTDYGLFLKIKSLPKFRFTGRTAEFPDEYAASLGLAVESRKHLKYRPSDFLFDYQKDISRIAIEKEKFAVFADPGLGKTLIAGEFIQHAKRVMDKGRCALMVSPLMVVDQTMAEFSKFYKHFPIRQVRAHELKEWLVSGKEQVGITNYDAITDDLEPGRLDTMILDESSILKSHYGKWGMRIIYLGRGLHRKLCLTGTPAPNDRIEYANHAVFLDHFPTVNTFLARFFVNRGETGERWELKPHALEPFYRALSHWSIFLTNPATYGWKDNVGNIPPIYTHIHEVPMSQGQHDLVQLETGALFAANSGGIGSRSVLSQIGKGNYRGAKVESNKAQFIRDLVATWPEESTIIWCKYNAEQDLMAATFPDAANISGDTPYEDRMRLIGDFKEGRRKQLISKPRILGLGLNLQVCTRMVFSGLQDSYEEYYQAVKRANRVGSTRPLNVHIPLCDVERPMVQTVMSKCARVLSDTEEQERIFRQVALTGVV